jgi:alanyl-tRNA synthetase
LQKILAERYRDAGDVLLFLESGDAGKTAEAVAAACGGVCRVFVLQGDGFRYAMAQVGGDLSASCRALHAALGGKGGGRGGLVQGSVPAARREIEAYFGRES